MPGGSVGAPTWLTGLATPDRLTVWAVPQTTPEEIQAGAIRIYDGKEKTFYTPEGPMDTPAAVQVPPIANHPVPLRCAGWVGRVPSHCLARPIRHPETPCPPSPSGVH